MAHMPMSCHALSHSHPGGSNPRLGILLAALLLMLPAGLIHAANKTSVASGNWNSAATWSPPGVPAAGDKATIATGTTVTVNANVQINDVVIQAGAVLQGDGTLRTFTMGKGGGEDLTNSGTLNFGGATPVTLNLNKDMQLGGNGTWNINSIDLNNKKLRFTAGSSFTINLDGAGDPLLAPGEFNTSAGCCPSNANITVNYNGTSAQTLSADADVRYGSLVINNAAGVTLGRALTTTNLLSDLSVQSGTLHSGGFTIAGAAAAQFSVSDGATFSTTTAGANAMVSGFGSKTFEAASTVAYAGANQTVTAETYGNLGLSGSATKTPVAGTTIVAGNFALASGVTFAGTTNNPNYQFAGNFANSGTFNSGTGTYTFNGAGAQGFTGATTFTNLTLNNSGSAAGTGLILASNLTVTTAGAGSLVLSDGVIETGANRVIVTRDCTTANVIQRTSGHVAGNLQLRFPTGANRACNYPVGDPNPGNVYSPVLVTFASVGTAGDLVGRVTSGEAPDAANSPVDSNFNVNRYWTLTQGTSAVAFTTYSAAFTYVVGDNDAGATPSIYIVGKADACGATCTWTSPALSGTPTSTSAAATGMTAFSNLVVGQPRPQLSSFGIDVGAGTASTCLPRTVTITALRANGSTLVNYTGSVTISTLSAHGDWSVASATGVLTNGAADDGVATYTFTGAGGGNDNGVIQLNLSNSHADDLTVTVSDSAVGVSTTSLTLQFRDNAFVITGAGIPVAGKAESYSITMIRRDPNTGSCGAAAGYAGSKNLKAWITRAANPNGDPGGAAPSLAGASLGNAAPGANNVTLIFAAGVASASLDSSDVGKYSINLRDDSRSFATGMDIDGNSSTLTVRPFGLAVTSIQKGVTANPGGTATGGSKFVPAGETFSATVSARLWDAADDANNDGVPDNGTNLADNGTANSFRWTTSVAALLDSPNGGLLGALSGTTSLPAGLFASGAATVSDLSYAEAGSIVLTASASGYLGTVGADASGRSGVVGRFHPDHFTLLAGSSVTAGCASGGFTYMDQQAIDTAFTVEARNKANVRTQNYAAPNYGFLAAITLVAEDANDGVDRSARLTAAPSATWTAGRYIVGSSAMGFSRNASPDGSFESLALGIRPLDAVDGVTLGARDMNTATAGDCVAAANCDASQVGSPTRVRFGRLRISNAFGAATRDLALALTVQYYNGTFFLTNASDSCTQLDSANLALSNFSGALSACETGFSPSGAVAFSAGIGRVTLSKPGQDNAGSTDLRVNLNGASGTTCNPGAMGATGAGKTFLRGDWGSGTYDEDPRARATFGIYRNANEFIYLRELY
jgi:MSHA biogenesis protein MshQ